MIILYTQKGYIWNVNTCKYKKLFIVFAFAMINWKNLLLIPINLINRLSLYAIWIQKREYFNIEESFLVKFTHKQLLKNQAVAGRNFHHNLYFRSEDFDWWFGIRSEFASRLSGRILVGRMSDRTVCGTRDMGYGLKLIYT